LLGPLPKPAETNSSTKTAANAQRPDAAKVLPTHGHGGAKPRQTASIVFVVNDHVAMAQRTAASLMSAVAAPELSVSYQDRTRDRYDNGHRIAHGR